MYKTMHTSQEIIWATARCPPIRAYLELDPHLVRMNPQAVNLITARIIMIFIGLDLQLNEYSYHVQYKNIKANLIVGPRKYMTIFILENFGNSLVSSFTASVIGWEIPASITLLGPFRQCMSPITFRSMRVKKATLRSTPIMAVRKSRQNILVRG